eukprot:m.322351 g.322351  ORF g.322351 m.322351 type:complete len:84 (-) comp20349_c0_seq7:109-360(-)
MDFKSTAVFDDNSTTHMHLLSSSHLCFHVVLEEYHAVINGLIKDMSGEFDPVSKDVDRKPTSFNQRATRLFVRTSKIPQAYIL